MGDSVGATEPCRHPEIFRHAANQEPRRAPGSFQQERQNRRRRGLAVGAGHRQRVAAWQHVLGQPLRAAGVAAASVQHRFHRRVATRERIADDNLVAIAADVARQVTLRQGNAQCFQLGGHGRVHRLVTAFDRVPEFARQGGHAAHESAGNAENVDLAHAPIVA